MDRSTCDIGFEVAQGSDTIVTNPKGLVTRSSAPCGPLKSLFPATRYYGSKLRLVDWIASSIAHFDYHTVLDAFGGTATVSLLFKHLGKDVTYIDIFVFNNHTARAVLSAESRNYRLSDVLAFSQTVTPVSAFISNTFKGVFYLDEENRWLDGAAQSIVKKRDVQFRSDLYYCLFQACLQKRPFNLFHRNNLNIRINNTKDTKFGNWRTWERPFSELIERAAKDLSKAKRVNRGNAQLLFPSDALKIPSGYDLVYIDPPYIKQTKNDTSYLDRYHFLEGLCRYREWPEIIEHDNRILRLQRSQVSDEWAEKDKFRSRLFELISAHRQSIVVCSYASGGYPSIEELARYFRSQFKNVVVFYKTISHVLRKKKNDEVVILGVN